MHSHCMTITRFSVICASCLSILRTIYSFYRGVGAKKPHVDGEGIPILAFCKIRLTSDFVSFSISYISLLFLPAPRGYFSGLPFCPAPLATCLEKQLSYVAASWVNSG
jgi:hypothetical protein